MAPVGSWESLAAALAAGTDSGTNTEQKPEGSGLGLAIAKGIIEIHSGTISVSSIPTVGTTFQIEFSHR